MTTGDGAVLLTPVVNQYDALTSVGKVALGRALLARDGYVEWCDGDRVERWTLPDQPTQSGLPVLTSVIEADTWFKTLRGDTPERYVLLADENGAALAVLALITTAAGPTYEQVDFDRIWPQQRFDGLMQRGVKRTRETYPDVAALNRAHPGTVARWRVVLGSRASSWTGAALLAAAILAAGIRVIAG